MSQLAGSSLMDTFQQAFLLLSKHLPLSCPASGSRHQTAPYLSHYRPTVKAGLPMYQYAAVQRGVKGPTEAPGAEPLKVQEARMAARALAEQVDVVKMPDIQLQPPPERGLVCYDDL